MDEKDLCNTLSSVLIRKIKVTHIDSGFKITLPFSDSSGESIEIYAEVDNGEIILDDFGHTAGLLFQLGQHGYETVGNQFTRNVIGVYDAIMDYDRGVVCKSVSLQEPEKIIDFIQLLTTIRTALPEMKYRKRVRRVGRRLATVISREIKQLKLPLYVQRQTEIEGKNEIWMADFKYSVKLNGYSTEVIILTTDLKWGEPREKVAHALTLAVDVLGVKMARELRIIYELSDNSNGSSAKRAALMIEDYQSKIGYKAYNYGQVEVKAALTTQINQELSPYLFKKE